MIGDHISNPNRPNKEGILPLAQIGGVLDANATGLGGGGTPKIDQSILVVDNHAEAAIAAALAALRSHGGQTIIIDSLAGDVNRGGSSAKAIRTKLGR